MRLGITNLRLESNEEEKKKKIPTTGNEATESSLRYPWITNRFRAKKKKKTRKHGEGIELQPVSPAPPNRLLHPFQLRERI